MRGRKPLPSKLKQLKGTARVDRDNPDEPKPKAAIPSCPPFLNEPAKAEWERITPILLENGLLTGLDRAALSGYCTAWGVWVDAETELEKQGLVIKIIDSQKQPQFRQNPYLKIADHAMAKIRQFAVEFGMTPSSRSRISVLKSQLKKIPLIISEQKSDFSESRAFGSGFFIG